MYRYIILAITVFLGLHTLAMAKIENSVVPLAEKYEDPSQLPMQKLTKNQACELTKALRKQDERIRLVSYNILFDLYDAAAEEELRWPARLPRILELLTEMNPDIISVQELYGDQYQSLVGALNNTYAFVGEPSEDTECNAIFFRRNRFQQIDCQSWKMPPRKRSAKSRADKVLTEVKLKDLRTNRVFTVLNTHFSFSDLNQREDEARFIAKRITQINTPILVTGDLNTFPMRLDQQKLPFYDGDYIHRILTKKILKDAREQSLLGHLGPLSSFTNRDGDIKPFTGTGTPGVFLDHIYISQEIQTLLHAIEPAKVNGYYPSDHMPVFIDFRL